MGVRVSAVVTLLWVAALAVPHAQQTPANSPMLTQVPRVMGLSGVFLPATIQPIASVESVTVAIYRDREGGEALWQETQSVAMEPGGRYSLLMGSTVADGLPPDLFTSGEARWIGIAFNRPSEVEQPRVPLASVPYALKAADADTLGGLPASAYLRTEAPASRATDGVSMQGSEQAAGGITPLSSGTPGYLGVFTDSANLGNSVLFQSGASVALGTTVPRDMFHVSFTDGNGALTGYGVQNLSGAASAYSGMLFYDQNSALGLFQGFNNATHEYRINNVASGGSINFRIAGSSKFLVANNGNIGIGVPAPASKLDVAGDINLTGALKMGPGTVFKQDYNHEYTAVGFAALANLTSPFVYGNTALGYLPLWVNTSGQYNTGVGAYALFSTNDSYNTAVGYSALKHVTGNNNIAIGYRAGLNYVGANSSNITIGNAGVVSDIGATRIGTTGVQTSFFAAGIHGMTTGLNDVVAVIVDSNGQLGTAISSRRYKEDIRDMGDASRGLMRLRPVTFRYTNPFGDGSKPIQYGLIAEEVAEVYPDLVVRSADGQIETVKYQVLDAMLLNEIQRQHEEIRRLQERLAVLEAALPGDADWGG